MPYSQNYLKPCTRPNCDKRIYAKGVCLSHYARFNRTGNYDPMPVALKKLRPPKQCKVKGCAFLASSRGLCKRHYTRLIRHGSTKVVFYQAQKGTDAEEKIAQIFRAFGREVKQIHRQGDGDLSVDGLLIEVKCSESQKVRGVPTWRFNIHRHGALNEKSDYYILRFERVPYHKSALHAAFKAPLNKYVIQFSMRAMICRLAPAIELYEKLRDGKITVDKPEGI